MSSSRSYHAKSRNVPTKVRRRQSDAKWRASVQSCYESLKLIIPESRRLNKRKLSKALILQETENHMLYLEDVLKTLLEEKEKLVNHGMIHSARNSPTTFQEVKDAFASKVQLPLAYIPKPRCLQPRTVSSQDVDDSRRPARKDHTSPVDSERLVCTLFQGDQFYYLSGQSLCLHTNTTKSGLTTPCSQPLPGGLLDVSHLHTSSSASSTGTDVNQKENVPPCSPLRSTTRFSGNSELENPRLSFLLTNTPSLEESTTADGRDEVFMPQLTPSKSSRTSDLGRSPSHSLDMIGRSPSQPGEMGSLRSPLWSATLSSIQHHPAFLTPSKVTRKLPFDYGTPTAVSSELKSVPCSPVTSFSKEAIFPLQLSGSDFMEVPCTPILKTPEECEPEDSERDDSGSLLCTESIESMELGDEAEWFAELQLRERKKYGQTSQVQQTPCQEGKGETISCRPSEKELQNRPKKGGKRVSVTSLNREVTPAKVTRLGNRPKCCKQLERLYDEAMVPERSALCATSPGGEVSFVNPWVPDTPTSQSDSVVPDSFLQMDIENNLEPGTPDCTSPDQQNDCVVPDIPEQPLDRVTLLGSPILSSSLNPKQIFSELQEPPSDGYLPIKIFIPAMPGLGSPIPSSSFSPKQIFSESSELPSDGYLETVEDTEDLPIPHTEVLKGMEEDSEDPMIQCTEDLIRVVGKSFLPELQAFLDPVKHSLTEPLDLSVSTGESKKGSDLQQVPISLISVPHRKEASDFDGYYYFYRQMSGALENHLSEEEINNPTFSEAISQMWRDMNEDQRTTLVTIAALENSESASSSTTELSEDLSDISVVPISNSPALITDFQVSTDLPGATTGAEIIQTTQTV